MKGCALAGSALAMARDTEMTPLTQSERRHALTRIASELDRQQQEARRAGADRLAFLIVNAMNEARALFAKV